MKGMLLLALGAGFVAGCTVDDGALGPPATLPTDETETTLTTEFGDVIATASFGEDGAPSAELVTASDWTLLASVQWRAQTGSWSYAPADEAAPVEIEATEPVDPTLIEANELVHAVWSQQVSDEVSDDDEPYTVCFADSLFWYCCAESCCVTQCSMCDRYNYRPCLQWTQGQNCCV